MRLAASQTPSTVPSITMASLSFVSPVWLKSAMARSQLGLGVSFITSPVPTLASFSRLRGAGSEGATRGVSMGAITSRRMSGITIGFNVNPVKLPITVAHSPSSHGALVLDPRAAFPRV